MIHFKYNDKAKQYVFLKVDNNEDIKSINKLKEKMNLVDPICYLKTYQGVPYTQDFIYEYVQKSGQKVWYASIGLTQTITNILKENNIEYDGIEKDRYLTNFNVSLDEFKSIVNSWNLKYTPRPYQYEIAYNILKYNRSISIAATRAGKTLCSYLIFRFAKEYLGVRRILMIVPGIDLVKQGYADFKEYGDYFNSECLWSGGKVVESSDLTIATFQTLVNFLDKTSKRYNPSFFDSNGIDRCGYDMCLSACVYRMNMMSIVKKKRGIKKKREMKRNKKNEEMLQASHHNILIVSQPLHLIPGLLNEFSPKEKDFINVFIIFTIMILFVCLLI